MNRIKIDYPETTLFTCRIPIRITDLNYGNHLAHDILVSILHEARVRFLRAHDMEEWDIDGCGLLVVDLGVRYLAQAFYGQELEIEVALGEPSTRGCDLLYRVTDAVSGGLVALAKTGIVFFDRERGRVANTPASFRRLAQTAAVPGRNRDAV